MLTGDQRLECTLALAASVRQRRQQLELTIEAASDLAGLAFSQWCALESGWIPEDTAVINAICETLTTSLADIALLATIGRTPHTYDLAQGDHQ